MYTRIFIFVVALTVILAVFTDSAQAQEFCPEPEPCTCEIPVSGAGGYFAETCAFGMSIEPGGVGDLTNLVVIYDPDSRCPGNSHGFMVCWEIQSVGEPDPAFVSFYLGYTEEQIAGLNEGQLRPFAFDTSWHPGAFVREVDTDGNVLIALFLTEWYPYWFGAEESPTAVTLTSFTADSDSDLFPIVWGAIGIVLIILLGVLIGLRRLKHQ